MSKITISLNENQPPALAPWDGALYAANTGHHRVYDALFLETLPLRPADTVLDLGCGSGDFTAIVAARVPDGTVVGLDPQPSLLAEARSLKKPVVMDFYATWCTPCRELEEITFHDAAVVKLAENAFVMVKVDVTGSDNPTHDRLLREYGIKGVPTVVFLDPEGNERRELRLVDYLSSDQMLDRMTQLLKSGG